jgi:hypothetical protein
MLAGRLEIEIATGVARLQQDMQQATGIVNRFAQDADRAIGMVKSAFGALGLGIGVGGLSMLAKQGIDTNDALGDMAKTTRVAADELAGLRYLADQTGGSLEGTSDALVKLEVEMGKNAEKFAMLGVTARDPVEALRQLADVTNAIQDPQQRAAVLAEALKKSWKSVAPLLAEGGANMAKTAEEGRILSGVTEELVRQSDAFNDKLVQLGGNGGALNRILAELLPVLNLTADGLLAARDGTSAWSTVGFALAEVLKVVVVVIAELGYMAKTVGNEIGSIAAQTIAVLQGDFARATEIARMQIADEDARRKAFDSWAAGLMAVGSAATGTAAALHKLDMGDQASRRAASEAAAQARAFLNAEKNVKAEDAMRKAAEREAKRRLEELAREAERLRKEDVAGWVRYADAVFAEAEKLDIEMAKIHADFWKGQDKLRDDDTAGWIKAIDAQVAEYERGLKEIGDRQPSALEVLQAQWADLGEGITNVFEAGFRQIGNGWKAAMSSMRDVFLRELMQHVWTAFAKPLILNVMANLTGGAGGLLSGLFGGGGGLGGLLGGGLGSFLGIAGGALAIGSLLHSIFDDGPENEKFKINQGAGSGPFGGVEFGGNYGGADKDALNGIVGGFDSRLAGLMSPEAIAAALEKIKAYTAAGLRMDGQPAEFAFPEGDKTAGEQIALELLQSRYGIIFDGLDAGIATQIRNWSGTSTELQAFIEASINSFEALPEAAAAARQMAEEAWGEMQAIIDQINGTHGGRTVEQMATEFQTANAWAAGMTVTQLVQQFLTITKDDYLAYDEAQRALIRDITRLGNTAEDAADSINASADAMAGFSGVYGLTADQLARNRQIEEANRLAAAFEDARQAIRDYLHDMQLGEHSILDPAQQLKISVDQFWQAFSAAMAGDLNALDSLPGLADLLLDLARANYASGSGFVDLYEWVRNLLGLAGNTPGAEKTYEDKVLDAGEVTAEYTQLNYEVNVEVRELLLQIRDTAPKIASDNASTISLAIRNAFAESERR